MPADPQRVRSLFLELVEHIPPTEWPARLAAACGDDAELRQRVQQLLDAHGLPDPLLDAPDAPPPTLDHPGPIREGSVIGPYKLLERLGAGGMGEVWVAHRRQPMQQLVALKLIKPGMDTAQVLARFEAERQALALMDHPNIAHVYDAGTTPDGRPYFVMELVKGVPITQYCDEHGLTVRQRLELFLPVCQAVQHAHQKGIIHRDLKPSNVLVAEYDDTPAPKVIDFGIAKSIAGALTAGTVYSEFGCILGTVQYMSPEQAKLNQLDVDTRSDVYSLGILLYELLTGTPPLEQERLKAVALDEVLRVIREEEPPKPSTRLSTSQALPSVAARRHAEPADLPKQVSGELDCIVMMALHKERKRRYQSAASLAEDVQHHLRDEPVKARPPSVGYRLGKFVRRYRWPVAAATAILAALLLGVVGTTLGMIRAEQVSASLRQQLYVADMGEARQAWETGDLVRLEALLRRHVPREHEEDNRGFEWFYLWRLWHRDASVTHREAHGRAASGVYHLALSADERHLALAHPRGPSAVTVLDMGSQEPPQTYGRLKSGWNPAFLAFSKDGKLLAHHAPDGQSVVIQYLNTGQQHSLPAQAGVTTAAISADGATLAWGCTDGSIRLWDPRARSDRGVLPGHTGSISALAFAPENSNRLVSASSDRTIRVWNTATKQPEWTGDGSHGPVLAVAWSPDGTSIATGGMDRTVGVWDARTGRRLQTLIGGRDQVRAVAFSCDGKVLAAGSRDFQIRLWDVPEFTERELISGYNSMFALAFLKDGRLVYGSPVGGIAFRAGAADQHADIIPSAAGSGTVESLVFSADGRTLVAQDSNKQQLRLVRVTPQGSRDEEPLPVPCQPGPLAVSPNNLLAVGDRSCATVHLYDLTTGRFREPPKKLLGAPAESGVQSLAFSPSGKRLVVALKGGALIAWEPENPTPLFERLCPQGTVTSLCFCGDERTLLIGGEDRSVRVWDIEQPSPAHDLGPQVDDVVATASSGTGNLLAAGIWSGGSHVRVWRRPALGKPVTLSGHFDAVNSVAFLQDGRTLISAGSDRTLRLWDATTAELRFVFEGGTSIFHSLAVSPDDRILAAGDRHGSIRLFRAASPEEVKAVPGWWRRTDDDNAP